MFLFHVTVKLNEENKPIISWMHVGVKYPVYSIYNRSEKLDHPPGFKLTTWLMIGERGGKRLDWINAAGVDYAGDQE